MGLNDPGSPEADYPSGFVRKSATRSTVPNTVTIPTSLTSSHHTGIITSHIITRSSTVYSTDIVKEKKQSCNIYYSIAL